MDPFIYLLMAPADYDKARADGVWDPPSRAAEGFIHASPAGQLTRVANKHYRHHDELRVVPLRADRLTAEVRWEPAAGALYPHVYGPINMDAAGDARAVRRGEGGEYAIDLGTPDAG